MKPSNTIFVSPKYIEEKERQITYLSKKVERLQEQLKEANDCINSAQISLRGYMLKINEYKKKWGVK